jgi:choline dehydrogenase-like flavoprotein
MRDDQGEDVTCSFPLPIYTAYEAFMKPRVVPHNRPPQVSTYGNERTEMRMTEQAVVIAGAGPAGMMLAAELTLAGTDVLIVERRASFKLESSRSRGLHSRTIEVLDQRGVVDRFLAEGKAAQVQAFAGVRLDISDFPTRRNYGMALLQSHFERILAGWLDELGVPILREREVTGFTQHDSGVNVTLSDGTSLPAQYLVGCDGGRSAVRKAAGIDFAGWDPTTRWIIAEVETEEVPEFGLRGGGGIGPAEDGRVGSPSPCPWTTPISRLCRMSATRSSGLTARTTACAVRTGSPALPT